MLKRTEHREEAIISRESVRRYAEAHERHAGIIYRAVLKDIKALNISGKCLEVGAGPGILAIMVAEQIPHTHITAIDISPDMVTVARELIQEKGMQQRIDYVVGDVNEQTTLEGLGKFDFVYSTFSLHHWKKPVMSLMNLWKAVNDAGILYIHDFKRVWWMHLLPLGKGDKESVKAAYLPSEIRDFLNDLDIEKYEIKTPFPFFLQSIIMRK